MTDRPATAARPALRARPHAAVAVELRATTAGDVRHAATHVHHISILTSEPVRVSCHANRVRSVRAPGEINLIPAGKADDWIEDDDGRSLELRLAPSLVRAAAEDMGLDPDRAGLEERCHIRDAHIEHIAWALHAAASAGFPAGRLYSDALGLALSVHLLAGYRAPAPPRAGLSEAQLRRVSEYIEAHLDLNLSLPRLARVAGLSASHFKALFKRSTGLPVHEYVIQRRVDRARALLARGDLPVGQVALEVGFAHQSHMARHMRRNLGVTPAAIRRSFSA